VDLTFDNDGADARKQAMVLLGSPLVKTKAPKFGDALLSFFDIHGPTLKPRTLKELKRVLNRHFLPALKSRRLDTIEHSDISGVTDELAKKTPSEAWHAFKDARTFFKCCVPRYIKHSSMKG
jgi:hypothetical protein